MDQITPQIVGAGLDAKSASCINNLMTKPAPTAQVPDSYWFANVCPIRLHLLSYRHPLLLLLR